MSDARHAIAAYGPPVVIGGDEFTTAWYTLHVKAIDDAADVTTITGIATTPEPDRRGDIVDPLGATYADEIPLLLHHDKERPVGLARLGAATAAGIPFTAWLRSVAGPAGLRERIEEARSLVKNGLLKGISIGYRAVPAWMKPLASGGFLFVKSEILELSLVTVGANPSAGITGIKALDLAASGPNLSAVADASKAHPIMQTIQEQITHWTTERGPIVQQMTELVSADRTLADQEAKSYDTLAGRLAAIDEQVARLRVLEKANMAAATPIQPTAGSVPTMTKAVAPIKVTPIVPPGTAFVRAVCANIICKGNKLEAAAYADRWKDSTPEVAMFLKAAVAPANTADPAWAGSLVGTITGEFMGLLRPATAIGRIPGMRKVPFNTKVPSQTGGGTYNWVGEAKPKPVTKLALSSTTLPMHKSAGIIVLTEELARLSNPDAEDVARQDMINGIAAFVDSQFIDPASAAVVNVKPASITNGVTPIASVGPLSDLVAIAAAFTTAGVPLNGLTYIMSPNNALVLSFQRESNGALRFPDMTAEGGKVNGLNVVTSGAAGANVIGLIPSLVLYGDDGGVTVDVSREASLQMSDTPMDPADATTVFVSLWQNNLVGLRAEWFVSWLKAHAHAVKYVNNAAYTIPAAAGADTLEAPPAGKNHRRGE